MDDNIGDVTVVLDGVGGAIGRAAMETLAPGGRLILFGYASGEMTPLTAGDLFRFGITATAAIGRRLTITRDLETRALAAAANGTLKPAITHFPLADAAAPTRRWRVAGRRARSSSSSDYSLRSGVRSSGSASSISLVKMRSPRL